MDRVRDSVRNRVRDRDMGRVRDRVRLRGLAIAAPSYSGPQPYISSYLDAFHSITSPHIVT